MNEQLIINLAHAFITEQLILLDKQMKDDPRRYFLVQMRFAAIQAACERVLDVMKENDGIA